MGNSWDIFVQFLASIQIYKVNLSGTLFSREYLSVNYGYSREYFIRNILYLRFWKNGGNNKNYANV